MKSLSSPRNICPNANLSAPRMPKKADQPKITVGLFTWFLWLIINKPLLSSGIELNVSRSSVSYYWCFIKNPLALSVHAFKKVCIIFIVF